MLEQTYTETLFQIVIPRSFSSIITLLTFYQLNEIKVAFAILHSVGRGRVDKATGFVI